MNERIMAILSANKGRWLGETEIVRAAYPGKRDSQITDEEWQSAINALRETGARNKTIGHNAFVWSTT